MRWKTAGVGSGLGVEFRHVIDVLFRQPAAVVDCGNLCRQWSEANVLLAASLVADLCGLALDVVSGVAFHLRVVFYGLFLLNEMEVVRGRTIAQDKMLHGVKPLVELIGQISGSNSWIKFLDQIHRSNPCVKSACQTQPILGSPRASLGERMATPTDKPRKA